MNPGDATFTSSPMVDWVLQEISSKPLGWGPTPSCWVPRWLGLPKHRATAGTGGWKQHIKTSRAATGPTLAPSPQCKSYCWVPPTTPTAPQTSWGHCAVPWPPRATRILKTSRKSKFRSHRPTPGDPYLLRTALKPLWIGFLIVPLAVASLFVVLTQWQFAQSTAVQPRTH